MKKTILKYMAYGIFALLMVFNVTTTMNSTNFSLTGSKVLAQVDPQEKEDGVEVNCTGHCSTDGCSISGYSNQGCVAGGCYANCVCSGYDENGNRVSTSSQCTPIAD